MKRVAIFIAFVALVLPAAAKQKPDIKSQWQGTRVAYLGDSITETRQIEIGRNDTYWLYLEQILGIESFVYAISGKQWKHIPQQTDKLLAERGQDIDAIIILMGTNDYNASVPIGQWYTEEVVKVEVTGPKGTKSGIITPRKKRTLVMDDKTVCGRINIAMSKLKETYPTKQIILLTPTHRGDCFINDRNIQPDEMHANGVGEYVDAYVDVVKEAGNVWAVPVIDLNAISGLYPMAEANAPYWIQPHLEMSKDSGKKRRDRLHPNSAGHLRMAKALAYQLLGYPAKLD